MPESDDQDNRRNGWWPWSDQTFQNMKAEHERFMNQVKEEGQRLQRRFEGVDDPTLSGSGSPFASFKRFIDDNINILADGFRNFPVNVAEIRTQMQQEQEFRREQELDISRRWTGSSDSPDHIRMELERSTPEEKNAVREATLRLMRESWKKNHHVPIEKIIALFADPQSRWGDLDQFATPMLSWGGACYYKPEAGDNLPSTRTWAWTCGQQLRWLSVDWFKRSPYSPVRLEAHPEAGLKGAMWRAAFEDLLNASLDKPMTVRDQIGRREPYGEVQHTLHGPGLDWMLSLQCRGILPPQLPRVYTDLRTKPGSRKSLLADILDHGAERTVWPNDSLFGSHSAVEKDFSELMSVVGTKASAKSDVDRASVPQTTPALPSPATELDVYEHFEQAQGSWQELDCTDDVIWAIENDDEEALKDVFHRWSRDHADLRNLLRPLIDTLLDPDYPGHPTPFLPMIAKALRDSDPSVSENSMNDCLRNVIECLIHLGQNPDDPHLGNKMYIIEEFYRDLLDFIEYSEPGAMSEQQSSSKPITREIPGPESALSAQAERSTTSTSTPTSISTSTPTPTSPTMTTTTPQSTKPNILSALTTTETTRTADGQVITKVVLKRRFADGSEETRESEHIEYEPASKDAPLAPEPEKKKGWFWS